MNLPENIEECTQALRKAVDDLRSATLRLDIANREIQDRRSAQAIQKRLARE